MEFTTIATPGHESSFPLSVINPHCHATEQESYTLRIRARDLSSPMGDEEILARFCKGFWGGWAFSPERWLFKWTGASVTKFTGTSPNRKLNAPERVYFGRLTSILVPGKKVENLVPTQIWYLSEFSTKKAPVIGSLLFNNFLVLDCSNASLVERTKLFPSSADIPRPTFAFADFAAGSNESTFSMSHRFEVTREQQPVEPNGEEEMIKITFSHVRCSPKTGGKPFPAWILPLHVAYAKLLFNDGIRAVMAK